MVGCFSINSKYVSADFQKLFYNIFRSSDGKTLDNDGVKIIHYPFTCAVLPNFLETSNLDDLEAEAQKFPLNRQQNDLFSLNQSNDLISSKDPKVAKQFPLLSELRAFFAVDMLRWMKSITGAELDENVVNSTISRYDKNDYLLCHDDELDRRRIAFIIYLVPEDWDIAKDGGALDLYETGPTPACREVPSNSGDYHPWRIVKSISPARNCLAFFEVCSKSFHQVAEIIGDRCRLSIHGWFMSDPLPRVPRSPDPIKIPRLPACFIEEKLVFDWVNPVYIDSKQQEAIRNRFIDTSEIQLPQFFRKANYDRLCLAIQTVKDNVWLLEGPMDLRNISVLPYGSEEEVSVKLPEACREVRRLLHSEAILLILSQLTGVSLHPLVNNGDESTSEDPSSSAPKRARIEPERIETVITAPRFHRWRAGMYTLLADTDSGVVSTPISKGDNSNVFIWRLDAFFHIGGYGAKSVKKKNGEESVVKSATGGGSCDEDGKCWQDDWNGEIVYVSRSDNEELLRVRPEDNALTLVYCEAADTAKFVRYLNAKASPLPLPVQPEDGTFCSPAYAFDVSLSYFHESEDTKEEESEGVSDEEPFSEGDEDDNEEVEESDEDDEDVYEVEEEDVEDRSDEEEETE